MTNCDCDFFVYFVLMVRGILPFVFGVFETV